MSNEAVIDLNALDHKALREVARSLSMRLTEYFVDILRRFYVGAITELE